MRYYVTNIVWEIDEARPRLPRETWVECEDEEEIADALSDTYGWLVADFEVQRRIFWQSGVRVE